MVVQISSKHLGLSIFLGGGGGGGGIQAKIFFGSISKEELHRSMEG